MKNKYLDVQRCLLELRDTVTHQATQEDSELGITHYIRKQIPSRLCILKDIKGDWALSREIIIPLVFIHSRIIWDGI